MAKDVKKAKVTLTHPRTGTRFNIDSQIYKAVKAAILQSLKGSRGKTFTELADDVVKIIKKKIPAPAAIGIKKSIAWYAIYIRLHLETEGIVETFTQKGRKLNRLAAKLSG
jgi:hypothetical protein